MEIANMDIRNIIKESNLKYWQVADSIGLNDGNFSRLLRKELPKEKKEEILQAINKLLEEN